jgi:histidine triad (HIT) family protein
MSLAGAYDESNVFARILRGELPCAKVHEDAAALTLMDAFPQTPGHCLVVPKVRVRTLLELGAEGVGPLFARVHQMAQAVVAALEPDGVVVTQFNGAPAGQTVFHLHVHIIPRYAGQALQGHGQGPMADMAQLQALAARIAARL